MKLCSIRTSLNPSLIPNAIVVIVRKREKENSGSIALTLLNRAENMALSSKPVFPIQAPYLADLCCHCKTSITFRQRKLNNCQPQRSLLFIHGVGQAQTCIKK